VRPNKRIGKVVQPLRGWLEGRSEQERQTLARLWSLGAASSAQELADVMLAPDTVQRVVRNLGPEAERALRVLQERGGAIPAPIFEREFGRVRPHGDYVSPREYLLSLKSPPSVTEQLFLLGVLQEVEDGPRQSYAVPPDLLELLPVVQPREARLEVVPIAPPAEHLDGEVAVLERHLLGLLVMAHDGLLEMVPGGGLSKASLVRLARRWGHAADLNGVAREEQWPYAQFLRQVAQEAGLVSAGAGSLLRTARAALDWMRLGRLDRLRALFSAWVDSGWDELAALEGIRAQQPYTRDVPAARRALLALIAQVPAGAWVDLAGFVAAVKAAEPDYARPDGDYFRWGLQSRTKLPLSGFINWDLVEGAQIRGVVACSLRWLGLADAGLRGDAPASFRLTAYGEALLRGAAAPPEPPQEPLVVQPNFEVVVPAYAPLYAQFQLGRIAEAPVSAGGPHRLTRRSVQAALEQGIGQEEMLRFLEEQSGRPTPQNVAATLRDWAGRHGQLTLQRGHVLRARDRLLLEQVRRDRRVRMPPAEELGEAALLVRDGDAAELAARLRKAGYGLAGDGESDAPLSESDLAVVVAALEFYAGAASLLGAPCEASAALRRRAAGQVPQRLLNRAHQASGAALEALRARLEAGAES
jgi:hypothetical protein